MSEHERQGRPGSQRVGPGALPGEQPQLGGGGVEADRAWAQQRIRNHFAANRLPNTLVQRKASDGAPAAAGQHEVSQPGEPAEQEADAVGDKVADELHGGGGAHKAVDGAKQAAPAIGAKLDGVGRKVFLAIDPKALAAKVTRPNDRHYIAKVKQSTLKKDKNSVIESSVNVNADVNAIRAGSATSGNEDGVVTFTVNGRTYGAHEDGVLFPMRGAGIHELDRGAFQALGVLNELRTEPAKAEEILKKIKTTDVQKAAAMAAFKAG